jgi:hypothetical protein
LHGLIMGAMPFVLFFFSSAPTAAGADVDVQLGSTWQHIRTDRGDTGQPEIRPRR